MKRRNKPSAWRNILDALHRIYAVKDIKDFPRELMAATESIVPCVTASFDAINLSTGQATNVFHRETPMPREEFMLRWTSLCHEHPGIAFLERGGKATVMQITDFMSQRQFRRTALCQEVFQACGSDYQMGVILPVPGHVVGMAINRDTDFAAKERMFIEYLHPHIVQAFQNAQLFTALQGHKEVDFRVWRNDGLTRRECEVLEWVMEGKRNSEIAVILGAKTRTVGKHVENLLAKLGVETRAAAAAEARRRLQSERVLPF
ncbi:MAG: helix-turn-helix transcriptional regulator [Chthoniobacter sp.]